MAAGAPFDKPASAGVAKAGAPFYRPASPAVKRLLYKKCSVTINNGHWAFYFERNGFGVIAGRDFG